MRPSASSGWNIGRKLLKLQVQLMKMKCFRLDPESNSRNSCGLTPTTCKTRETTSSGSTKEPRPSKNRHLQKSSSRKTLFRIIRYLTSFLMFRFKHKIPLIPLSSWSRWMIRATTPKTCWRRSNLTSLLGKVECLLQVIHQPGRIWWTLIFSSQVLMLPIKVCAPRDTAMSWTRANSALPKATPKVDTSSWIHL